MSEAPFPPTAPPLCGLKVLDLSRILAGPVCCQVLADLGADVVKVERPGQGDDTRQWGPPFLPNGGPSTYFLSCNRGKRSLALDLNHPESRSVLDELIRRADVLVENFLPRDVRKFQLQPQRLQALNPNLVSCSISGYGRTGPMAEVAGYDLMVQATTGLMSITGEPDGMPMKVGVAISDIMTGLYAAISALAGIVAREKGRPGQSFDLALFDCTIASLVNVAQSALVTGQPPARYGNAHPQIVPYQAFATTDGFLVLGVGNDRQWQRFCQATHRDDLAADPRFTTNPLRVENRATLIPQLEQLLATRTTAEWQRVLVAAEVPSAPVLTVDQALVAEQTVAREMVVELESRGRSIPLLATPIHWPGRDRHAIQVPPAIGEHSVEVLREWLGKDARQIEELLRAQVIESASAV